MALASASRLGGSPGSMRALGLSLNPHGREVKEAITS